MQPTRDMAGFAEQVCAYLRAHPAFLAENQALYRVLLPPERVHGSDLADHMAAMLTAQRAHAQAMQDEADRVLAAGRAQAGVWARVQEAVLTLIESRFPIDCIATEFPRCLAVDAANLCAEAPILAARRLPPGSIASLFGARSVVFDAAEEWAHRLHGEASGLAQHQVLIRIPGHDALLALAARDAAPLDPAQGQACWLFLARAVAAALSR